MPSRHSASIWFKFSDVLPPARFYTSGYGKPEDMREFTRRAFRSRRRQILGAPDLFYFNLIREIGFRAALYLDQRELCTWTYSFNLVAEIPIVKIHSRLTKTS